MQYKRGIQITHQTEEVLNLVNDRKLPIVEEGAKYPIENISAQEAFARAFKTLLHEEGFGNALVSAEVIFNFEDFETDGKRLKIRLVFDDGKDDATKE